MATPPRKRTPAKKTTARPTRTTKTPPKSAPKVARTSKKAAQKPRPPVKRAAKTTVKPPPKADAERVSDPQQLGDLVQEFMDEFLRNVEASRNEGETPSWGPVEAATRADLTAWGVGNSALAQSAYVLARKVDESDSASEAATAGRELRMTVAAAIAYKAIRSGQNDPQPPETGKEPAQESELDRLRREREQTGRTRAKR